MRDKRKYEGLIQTEELGRPLKKADFRLEYANEHKLALEGVGEQMGKGRKDLDQWEG